jgi:hypothetical protein
VINQSPLQLKFQMRRGIAADRLQEEFFDRNAVSAHENLPGGSE